MKVSRDPDGSYHLDGAPLEDLLSVPGAVRAVKKPLTITARRMEEPFSVETTEGTMEGRAGDWLMQGVLGELYVCPADVFDRSYDVLDASAESAGS